MTEEMSMSVEELIEAHHETLKHCIDLAHCEVGNVPQFSDMGRRKTNFEYLEGHLRCAIIELEAIQDLLERKEW